MRWKRIEEEPKVFALIFETGNEIASVLQQFAKQQGLAGSNFKAIGALSYAKLAWLNWQKKTYEPACVLDEQVELLSLIGDIALKDGEPRVYAPSRANRLLRRRKTPRPVRIQRAADARCARTRSAVMLPWRSPNWPMTKFPIAASSSSE